jgi:hypothetical protein
VHHIYESVLNGGAYTDVAQYSISKINTEDTWCSRGFSFIATRSATLTRYVHIVSNPHFHFLEAATGSQAVCFGLTLERYISKRTPLQKERMSLRVVRLVGSSRHCVVLDCLRIGVLPSTSLVRQLRVLSGCLIDGVGDPRVPAGFNLRRIEVVLRVVYPSCPYYRGVSSVLQCLAMEGSRC